MRHCSWDTKTFLSPHLSACYNYYALHALNNCANDYKNLGTMRTGLIKLLFSLNMSTGYSRQSLYLDACFLRSLKAGVLIGR